MYCITKNEHVNFTCEHKKIEKKIANFIYIYGKGDILSLKFDLANQVYSNGNGICIPSKKMCIRFHCANKRSNSTFKKLNE